MNLRFCDRIGSGRPMEEPHRLRRYFAMLEQALIDPIDLKMLKIDGNENHGCKYIYFIQDRQNKCFVKGKEVVNAKNCSFKIPN